MFAGFRGKVLAGLLLVPFMVVLFGIVHVSQAGMVEHHENHRLVAQLMRIEPGPEPAIGQQEKGTTPAVRQPTFRATQEPVTVEEEDASQDTKEAAPLIQRPGREATKKEPSIPSRPPAKPAPETGIDGPAGVQPHQPALPAQPVPPPATHRTIRQQPPQLEHTQPPKGITSPGFEQQEDSPATERPWYQSPAQPERQQPVGAPVLRETRPPALPSRPAPGVMTPVPALKQPRFGSPVQEGEGVAIEQPMDHRPVQQEILSPRQQERAGVADVDLCPCTRGEGDYPIPRVTSYDPRNGVSRGGRITFSGTNFLADRVMVCIGDIRLETVSSSANQLVVQAPQDLITGALMISHGTGDSNYVLEENFRIIGDPVITSIQPTSFRPGDRVTVRGSDLFLYPMTTTFPESSTPNATVRFLKISNDPLRTQADEKEMSFITVYNYSHSADMTEIAFNVGRVFLHYRTYVVDGQVSDTPSYFGRDYPQPELLSGPLRFNPGNSDRFDFAGPNVTWQRDADEFLLTAVKPPSWGDQHPMFVIAADSSEYGISVNFEGSGLDGAQFRVGGELVAGGASAHGRDGFFRVKPSTPSGIVTATKSGVTVSYPEPLTIIPAPAFLPGTLPSEPFTINIDEVYELRGWDLLPANVSGLTYRFAFRGLENYSPGMWLERCNLEPQVLEHRASTLRFKVASTGPMPDECLSTTAFENRPDDNIMRLTAEYGGVQQELWRMPYRLAR